MRCPNCKTLLNLSNIKDKAGVIGECPNERCQKSWFIFPGENPGEFYAKPAVKAGKSGDLGSAEMIEPSSFEWHTSDFKFFKVNYFQGADRKKPGRIKTVGIKPIVDIKKTHALGPEGTIRIDFMFTIQMLPDVGEINFNGKCLIYSENPERIAAALENNVEAIFKIIKKDILKSAYPHARNFGKNKGHNLPPLDFIITNIGNKF